jgi:DNA-binding transcriptional LysR family regulator
MDLALNDLTVFLAVERRGSFGRAAAELLVTQPAVSERIRHLERTVGRRLFDRTTRGATLTVAGEALLPYAQRCVALAEEAVEATRQADGVPTLVIAAHATFAPRVVPLVLAALGDTPRRVVVRDAHSEVIPALVLDGTADLGFAIPAGSSRGLRRIALPPDPVRCFAAPDHPLNRLRRATPASLGDALLAVNAWGSGSTAFLARVRDAGVQEWRIRSCADAATAVTLARQHNHVAFVAGSSVGPLDGLRAIPIAGLAPWVMHLDLLHRTGDRADEVVAAVVVAAAQESKSAPATRR